MDKADFSDNRHGVYSIYEAPHKENNDKFFSVREIPLIKKTSYQQAKTIRVNSPNFGCLRNIRNGPQSGPPLSSKAKGREAALQFIMGPKAAWQPISL